MPARILILTAYYSPLDGGVETHARDVATYLAGQGSAVTVVTKKTVEGIAPIADSVSPVRIERVSPAGPRKTSRKWVMIPFALARILELRDSFDAIYCPGYQGIGLAALAAGRLLKRPVVLRSGNIGVLSGTQMDAPLAAAGLSPNGRLGLWIKERLRRAYLGAQAFVCVSREVEREALSFGVPRDRVHYLPNAADVDRFRPAEPGEREAIRAEQGWPLDRPICLYVGRLSIEKGVLDLLDAWRAVAPANALLVLVGPEMTGSSMDIGPAARQYVADYGLHDRVRFYGRSDDVARLHRAADVYVQPSHYEAFSNAVVEAMASGLPIVASRVSGMLDCLVDDESGLLSEPRNPADLTRQLNRALADPALRVRLGRAARATVVAQFNRSILMTRFADLFEQLVAASRAAAIRRAAR